MNAAKKHLCLNSVNVCNWNQNAGPVAILNPDSTVHERIAYCYSQIGMLDTLLVALANHTDDEIRSLAGMVEHFTSPVILVLETLGDITHKETLATT